MANYLFYIILYYCKWNIFSDRGSDAFFHPQMLNVIWWLAGEGRWLFNRTGISSASCQRGSPSLSCCEHRCLLPLLWLHVRWRMDTLRTEVSWKLCRTAFWTLRKDATIGSFLGNSLFEFSWKEHSLETLSPSLLSLECCVPRKPSLLDLRSLSG